MSIQINKNGDDTLMMGKRHKKKRKNPKTNFKSQCIQNATNFNEHHSKIIIKLNGRQSNNINSVSQ